MRSYSGDVEHLWEGRTSCHDFFFVEWKLDWRFTSSIYFTVHFVSIFSENGKFCLKRFYVNHGYVFIGKDFPVFLWKLENFTLSEVHGQPMPSQKTPVESTVSGRTKYMIQCYCLFLININLPSCSSLFQLDSFMSLQ